MTFDEYIGIPYKDGGTDIDGFNCWGLLRYIQLHHFGVIIPEIPILDHEACADWFSRQFGNHTIESVLTPGHGTCVLLRGGSLPHVGVHLNFDGGGVLHALEGIGVIFTPMQDLKRMGYSRLKFYTYKNERSTGNTQEPISGTP